MKDKCPAIIVQLVTTLKVKVQSNFYKIVAE